MIKDVHIVDSSFGHAPGLCPHTVPRQIRWVRGYTDWVPVRFFTDRETRRVDDYPAGMNVALLIEPRETNEVSYCTVKEKINKFKYVLTHDREFGNSFPNGLIYKFGGCWIKPDDFWKTDDTKSELVSIIASNKQQWPGQQLRHHVISRFPTIPRFGGSNYVDSKVVALKPFAFSIIIENCRASDWFTEKIVDCFMCGTVPIYWGSPDIAETFNLAGIISFNNLEDLGPILASLSMDRWRSMTDAVLDNLERASHHLSLDEELPRLFPFLFP